MKRGKRMRYVGIDPSTKTGFVAIDSEGNVLAAKELTGVGKEDPKRMATLVSEVVAHLKPDDIVCIEGFAFASQQGTQLGGIGWAIRLSLYWREMEYTEVAPGQLKKFASGKGNTKKDGLAVHVYRQWEFLDDSDNVRDAFVLAQIARAIYTPQVEVPLLKYQGDVLKAILK